MQQVRDSRNVGAYTWNRNLIKHIPEEWKGVNRIHTPGGEQEMAIFAEHHNYSKEQFHAFQHENKFENESDIYVEVIPF